MLPLSAKPAESTNAAQREVIHTAWFSSCERIFRRADIYLPAVYDTCSQPVPALFLIHGINGYEGAWQDKGGAIDTLESRIAEGRCRPMILVMPDCNKWPFKERPVTHGNLWKCLFRYGKLSREHEIESALSELIDMIDTTYCVSTYAIAGLSDGGRISANVANRRPDKISSVGLFSPVLHKDQLPKSRDSQDQQSNDSLSLNPAQNYSIFVGRKDIFAPSGKRFHHRLTRAQYPHHYFVLNGSHNWVMWRQCLPLFMEQISDIP